MAMIVSLQFTYHSHLVFPILISFFFFSLCAERGITLNCVSVRGERKIMTSKRRREPVLSGPFDMTDLRSVGNILLCVVEGINELAD